MQFVNQTNYKNVLFQNSNYYKLKMQTNTEQCQDILQKRFYQKLNEFYDQCFLNALQKAGMTKYIKVHFSRQNGQVDRIKAYLLAKMNKKRIPPIQPGQKGCPDIIPGLRAKPWWDKEEFPWMKHFQDNYQQIRDQLLTLKKQKGFQPYRGPSWISERKAEDGVGNQSIDSGTWNVFYLQLHNMKFDFNCQKVPFTMSLINKYIPNNYHHAFFSALTSKSHIMKHHGPTNKKLRFHLPLMGVQNSKLRVDTQTKCQIQGKAYVFDDSFQHQAWHDGIQTRLILIVDFWHPDITATQLKFLKVIQSAKFKAQLTYSQMDRDKDNFYSIIQNAKDLIKENDWWVVNQDKIIKQRQDKVVNPNQNKSEDQKKNKHLTQHQDKHQKHNQNKRETHNQDKNQKQIEQ